MRIDDAVLALTTLLRAPYDEQWATRVRQSIGVAVSTLAAPDEGSGDGWVAGHSATLDRKRSELTDSLTSLGPQVLDHPTTEVARREIQRLLCDLDHFRQRLHDAVYDQVELELGGSE